jgi:hypothetical protein
MIFCGFKLSQEMVDTTQITKNWGFFKVNCGAMDGDLSRLKKRLEAQ